MAVDTRTNVGLPVNLEESLEEIVRSHTSPWNITREEKEQFQHLVRDNVQALLESPYTPVPLKKRVATALERIKEGIKVPSSTGFSRVTIYDPDIEVEEDPQRAATSLFDGGSFYTVTYHLPDLDLKFRVKRAGRQDKFERARRVQEYLMSLKDKGLLRGPQINTTTYSSDLKSKLSVEPFIDHDRLTDLLRGKDDLEKAEIIRQSVSDSLEISRAMTAYRDMKDEKGNYFLRKNYHWTDFVKNLPLVNKVFSGNYIIENQDPVDLFISDFALRTCPGLKDQVTRKGKISRARLGTQSLLRDLRKAFDQEFGSFYKTRTKHIVNKDNHTGNVLLDKATGDRVYCDFEFTYLDILEDPIAELVLTSGIQDQAVIKGIVDGAYEQYKQDINVSQEQFYATFQRRLIEKTLTRASRFLDFSERFAGTEKAKLRDQADVFYSLALDRMKEAGLEKTLVAVEAFNARHMKLKKTVDRSSLEGTLCSLVSNPTTPKTSNVGYKAPIEAWSARKFLYRSLIIASCAAGVLGLVKNCNPSAPEKMDYLKLAYQAPGFVFDIPLSDSSFVNQAMQGNPRYALKKIFGTENDAEIDSITQKYAPKSLKELKKTPYEWIFQRVSERKSADADMLRAIYYAGQFMKTHNPEFKKDSYGNMLWPRESPYYRDYRQMSGGMYEMIDGVDVDVATNMVKDNIRVNDGNIANTLASYMGSVFEMQEAEISSGSRKYIGYRKSLPENQRIATDVALTAYLSLKGLVPTADTVNTSTASK